MLGKTPSLRGLGYGFLALGFVLGLHFALDSRGAVQADDPTMTPTSGTVQATTAPATVTPTQAPATQTNTPAAATATPTVTSTPIAVTFLALSLSAGTIPCGASDTVFAMVTSNGGPVADGSLVTFTSSLAGSSTGTTTNGVSSTVVAAPAGFSGTIVVSASSGSGMSTVPIAVTCTVPVSPSPTAVQATAASGITTATVPSGQTLATQVPISQAQAQTISPPNTGDGGLN
jgi:hypothetical protein